MVLIFKGCVPNKQDVLYVCGLIGWVWFYFGFLFVGGVIITTIEKDPDFKLKTEKRNEFLAVLAKYNVSIYDEKMKEIIVAATAAYEVDGLDFDDLNKSVASSWHLGSAVFFCSTVVTTIGYGNIVPYSFNGRLFVILYALIGIPMTGVVLTKLGIALTALLKKGDKFIGKFILAIFGNKSQDGLKKRIRFTQLVATIVIVICCFWFVPAAIMTTSEEWDFMSSIYFCFISLTTIGLGDIVPGSSNNGYSVSDTDSLKNVTAITQQLSVLLYLLMGLAALTIILTLITSIARDITTSTMATAGSVGKNASDVGMKVLNRVSTKVKFFDPRKIGRVHPTEDQFTDTDGSPINPIQELIRKNLLRTNLVADVDGKLVYYLDTVMDNNDNKNHETESFPKEIEIDVERKNRYVTFSGNSDDTNEKPGSSQMEMDNKKENIFTTFDDNPYATFVDNNNDSTGENRNEKKPYDEKQNRYIIDNNNGDKDVDHRENIDQGTE